jgi:hypothetical protein
MLEKVVISAAFSFQGISSNEVDFYNTLFEKYNNNLAHAILWLLSKKSKT